MKRLIITADDFGAAREVNDAVEAAHRGGVLSAASLMVSAPATADAIARARRMPSLRIGLHLVLVEGRPVLPSSAVSHLVGADGRFRSNLLAYGTTLAGSRRARRELAAEITAQFAAFRDSGLALDHCNAHKHFHLHPVVGQLLAVIGRRFGLRAVRVPLEPARVLRKVEGRARRTPDLLTAPFALALRRRLSAAGLVAADRLFGLRWSGHMTRARLAGLIRSLPDGLTEIYLHPATGLFPGAAAGYRYREELEALLAPEVIAACRDPSLRLGGFGDFLETAAAAGAQGALHRSDMSHRVSS
ncbi:MAG TPA: hopanoid biosynthesis-associated protein HpnK [Steroidobacteraceae bacterium]|nr:hopanoid biosynthesis-associated protein HpnK [Steroidobacteraceae bacterium]